MACRESWSSRLIEHCLARKLGEPVYQDVSERRGGRTAWSTIAVVNGIPYSARFWYDGTYIRQAKEDASEVALRNLTKCLSQTTEPPPASYYLATAQGVQ